MHINESSNTEDLFFSSFREMAFRLVMLWRIFYGLVRLALGFVVLNLVGDKVSSLLYTLMRHELIEDPNDLLVKIASPIVDLFSFTFSYFLAAYLFFWAIIDIVLAILLLRHKLWAFPLTLSLIAIFICYEIYRLTYTHSVILMLVIIVDAFVFWLVRREYLNLVSKW